MFGKKKTAKPVKASASAVQKLNNGRVVITDIMSTYVQHAAMQDGIDLNKYSYDEPSMSWVPVKPRPTVEPGN